MKLSRILIALLLLAGCDQDDDLPTSPPTITSFTPTTSSMGEVVTITGTNFKDVRAVVFGGVVAAEFEVQNSTTIRATVAHGASGAVAVANSIGSGSKDGFIYKDCRLPEVYVRGDVGIGFPRISDRAPSTGTVKVNVIFVDFVDVEAQDTPQEVLKLISPSTENYFKTVSYGQLNLEFVPKFQWFRMSKPATEYVNAVIDFYDMRSYVREALELADPVVDFSNTDAFVILAPPQMEAISGGAAFTAIPPSGLLFDGTMLNNGAVSGRYLDSWSGFWFVHEFGHAMGLNDLYSYTGEGSDIHRYVGNFSSMGYPSGIAPEYFGWERWLLGWIDDSQVICSLTNPSGTISLTPVEKEGGNKIAVFPVDETSAVVVEERAAVGYDSQIPKAGLLVYFVNTSIASGEGSIRILPINSESSKLYSILRVGQSLSYRGITIKFTGSNEHGETVEYTRNR